VEHAQQCTAAALVVHVPSNGDKPLELNTLEWCTYKQPTYPRYGELRLPR